MVEPDRIHADRGRPLDVVDEGVADVDGVGGGHLQRRQGLFEDGGIGLLRADLVGDQRLGKVVIEPNGGDLEALFDAAAVVIMPSRVRPATASSSSMA